MEILWVLVGAGIAWAIFEFRATKRKTQQQSNIEFAAFILALDAWNEDRSDFEREVTALHHFEVYDIRLRDFKSDPTGRSIPALRAVLSQCWVKNLMDARLIDSQGIPSRWNVEAASFWDSVVDLRRIRDDLLSQSTFTLRD